MPRYIDADTLYQKIDAWREKVAINYGQYDDYVDCLGDVLIEIENAPTEDVVKPIKCHLLTIENPNYSSFDCSPQKIRICSFCEYDRIQYTFNYCPNCGAKNME